MRYACTSACQVSYSLYSSSQENICSCFLQQWITCNILLTKIQRKCTSLGSQSHPKQCLTSHLLYVFFFKSNMKNSTISRFAMQYRCLPSLYAMRMYVFPIERVCRQLLTAVFKRLTTNHVCLPMYNPSVAPFSSDSSVPLLYRAIVRAVPNFCDGICTQAMATEAGKTKKSPSRCSRHLWFHELFLQCIQYFSFL